MKIPSKRTKFLIRWHSMMRRCYEEGSPGWYLYGARGIKVCERWHNFDTFLADLGFPPEGLSMDRIDPQKGYEPGNVRWATPREQQHNRRDNLVLTFEGKTQNIYAWADEVGIPARNIYKRVHYQGWTPERALTTPVMRKTTHEAQHERPCEEPGQTGREDTDDARKIA